MGILDTLFGTNDDQDKMTERDIVNDMLKDSKFALNTLIIAITESNNPQVRQVLKQEFNLALEKHFRLADMVLERDWYHPHMIPRERTERTKEDMDPEMHRPLGDVALDRGV